MSSTAEEKGTEQREIELIIQEGVGTASACWENLRGAGVFQSERALEVSAGMIEALQPIIKQPRLGLATTEQLLDELRTRIELDYYSGGGGLGYTTVKGRPEHGRI